MNCRVIAFGGVLLAMFIGAISWSSINTILPLIKMNLGLSIGQLQWIMNAYGIFIASTLVAMGQLADKYGRKRIYLVGVTLTFLSMLGSGLSYGAISLAIFQAILGLGLAILLPISMALATQLYDEDKRSHVMGTWAAVMGIGLAIGPTVGGTLGFALGWRWAFLFTLPLYVISFILVILYVPESKSSKSNVSLDIKGMILLILTIGCFITATLQFDTWAHSTVVIFYIASIAFLIALITSEKHAANPIICEHLFKNRMFLLSSLADFILIFAVWVMFFSIPLFIHLVMDLSTLQTGFIMLGITIPLALFSAFAGKLYENVGPKILVISGFVMMALCVFMQIQFQANTSVWMVFISLLLFGLSWGLIWSPSTTAAISQLPKNDAGIATGTFTTFQEIGGNVGLAVVITIMRVNPDFLTGFKDGMEVVLAMAILGVVMGLFMKRTA